MEEIFKTYFLIIWGVGWGLAYLIFLCIHHQKKLIDLTLSGFFAVILSSTSIIGGFRLIYITFTNAIKDGHTGEMDKIYTIFGGAAIIWLAISNLYKKFANL